MNHPKRSAAAFVCLAVLAATSSVLLEGAPPAAKEATELPTYTIHEHRVLPPPESWRYVYAQGLEVTRGNRVLRTPGFEILSNLSEKNTRVFVEELQLRQLAGSLFWPSLINTRSVRPVIIMLDRTMTDASSGPSWHPTLWDDMIPNPRTEGGTEAGRIDSGGPPGVLNRSPDYDTRSPSENAERLLQPGMSHEALLPGASDEGKISARQGFGSSLPPNDAQVQLQADADPLPPGLATLYDKHGIVACWANASYNRREDQLAKQVGASLVKYLVSRMPQRPPVWLEAGLSWLVDSTMVSSTRIKLGGEPVRVNLKSKPSLEKICDQDQGELSADEVSWARLFTSLCMLESADKYNAGFSQFVSRTSVGPASPKIFKECFGITYGQMDEELNRLAVLVEHYGYSRSRDFPVKAPDFFYKFEVRDATQAEIAELKGDAYLAQDDQAHALDGLRIAYSRGERPPQLLAQLAEMEARAGAWEKARKLVSALGEKETSPARALFTRARLRFEDAMQVMPPGSKFSPTVTTSILTPLVQAIRGGLFTEELAALFSDTVTRSTGRPDAAIHDILEAAGRLYPENASVKEARTYISATPSGKTP